MDTEQQKVKVSFDGLGNSGKGPGSNGKAKWKDLKNVDLKIHHKRQEDMT